MVDSPAARRRVLPAAWSILGLALATLGVWRAGALWELYQAWPRLPLWDMAQNGLLGLRLAMDLADGDLLHFLLKLNEHDTWPFGFSLLLVPFFLVLEGQMAAATLAVITLFALVPLAVAWVGWELDRGPAGIWLCLLTVLGLLLSPMAHLLGILVLREVPGILFTLLAVALYLRALRVGGLWAWRLAWLGALALFFLKYNYGLLWIAAAGLDLLVRQPRVERKRFWQWLAGWLLPWRASGWKRVQACLILVLVALVLVGRSVGGLSYAVVWVVTVGLVAIYWRQPGRVVASLRARPVPVQAAFEALVVPVWLWCLSPDPVHTRGVLDFLLNRSSDLPFFEGLLFYPRRFLDHYLPSPSLAVIVGGLFLVGLVLALRRRNGWRAVAILATLEIVSLTLHPYKLPRLFAIALPWVFLLAAFPVALSITRVPRSGATRALASVALIASLGSVGWIWPIGSRWRPWLVSQYPAYSAPRELDAVLDALAELAAVDRAIGVIGGFNELSPSLVEWRLLDRPRHEEFAVVRALPRFSQRAGASEIASRVERWVEKRRVQEIVTLSVDAGSHWARSEDYRLHNAWQGSAVRYLAESPTWQRRGRRRFPRLGIEVAVWRPSSTTGEDSGKHDRDAS